MLDLIVVDKSYVEILLNLNSFFTKHLQDKDCVNFVVPLFFIRLNWCSGISGRSFCPILCNNILS